MSALAPGSVQPLCLYFPQWQGAAQCDGVMRGAQGLKKRLSGLAWREVDVEAWGDASVKAERGILHYGAVRRQLEACRQLLLKENPDRIFMLGGDCGVEVAPVSYLNWKHGGELGVVWLGAHGDLNTPESSPTNRFHGMPLRTLLGEGDPELTALSFGPLNPKQIFLAGARDLDPHEWDYLQGNAITWLHDREIMENLETIAHRVEDAGVRKLYVHVDLDVLDPAFFPYVKLPTPGGLAVTQLSYILKTLKDRFDLVGLSLTEFHPTSDHGAEIVDILGVRDLLGLA